MWPHGKAFDMAVLNVATSRLTVSNDRPGSHIVTGLFTRYLGS